MIWYAHLTDGGYYREDLIQHVDVDALPLEPGDQEVHVGDHAWRVLGVHVSQTMHAQTNQGLFLESRHHFSVHFVAP